VEVEALELPASRLAPLTAHPTRWRTRNMYIGLICGAVLCITAAIVVSTSVNEKSAELEQNIRVIHLPNGNVELGYSSGNQQAAQSITARRTDAGDYFPAGPDFREGYTYAKRAAPEAFPKSYSSGPAQMWRARQEEQEDQLQQQQLQQPQGGVAAQTSSPQDNISPASYQEMIEKLTAIHQNQELAQFRQQQLQAHLAGSSGAILSNEIMRSEAGQLEKAYLPAGGAQQRSAQRTGVVQKAPTQELSQLPSQMWQAPSFPNTVAPPPPAPTVSAAVQAPSTEVEINSLKARLQADEVAIATLTKDVQELRSQNAELIKHEADGAQQGPAPPQP